MNTGCDKGNISVAESKNRPGSDGPGRCKIEIYHWIFSVGVLFFLLQSVLASPQSSTSLRLIHTQGIIPILIGLPMTF